jgi:hypothetical protein
MMRHRAQELLIAAVSTAVLLSAGVVAARTAAAAPTKAAPDGLIWAADPARGTGVFQSLERAPGTIDVAADPKGVYGPSFRYETWDNADGKKERCESKGHRRPDGSTFTYSQEGATYYVGWRALWDPMPITRGRWTAFWQLHWYGAGPGGGPMTLRTLGDGKLHLQYVAPNGSQDRNIWSTALPLGSWNSFVVAVKVSKKDTDGYIEFWYNGVQQTFVNGTRRYPGATLKGDYFTNKWGVYRSGPNSGRARAYLNHARVATTYADAAP